MKLNYNDCWCLDSKQLQQYFMDSFVMEKQTWYIKIR